jgi:pimeloyl-ACP methyl ester carboxylesterase
MSVHPRILSNVAITPFTIDIPQDDLDDLRERLARTRRPPRVTHDWERGTSSDALGAVLAHWAGPFDWRAQEARLNRLDQERVDVDGLSIHVVRAGTRGATPLLLIHGWPDGFFRFEKAIPLLADRFELVIPSLPGYGFSDRPTDPTGPARTGDLLAGLMTALGHERFGVHGGDIGSTIGEQLALRHPDRVIGLHLGDIPFHRPRALAPADATDDDREWMARLLAWEQTEGAYARLQRTKPQTLAVGLEDSPAGLAAWLLEKYQAWSDGDALDVYSLDELCTVLTVYWATRTAGSSVHYYYDNAHSELETGYCATPTAVAQFPGDLLPAPRSSAERWFRVERWTQFARGGHFGPWEQPQLWAADVVAFFDQLAT